jgi:hypothetical protein
MPFIIPPLIKWTLGALGAAVAAQWLVREWRRVNAELDRIKRAPVAESATATKLRRDLATGVYTPLKR